jgi:hypothetical protein
MDVYEANSDVIGSVQWLATLDGRTTPLYRALDGLEWTLPEYLPKDHNQPFPGPSAHWNCRSVVIPITKTWEQLAKEAGGDSRLAKELDNIEPSERASLGGPVDASVTYQEWFAGQPEDVQRGILGAKRHEEYMRTGLLPAEMVGVPGGPLSLDTLMFWQRYNSVLKEAQKVVPCPVPIETRELTEAEIDDFKKRHKVYDPINQIAGFYNSRTKRIVFNQNVHRAIYDLDYSTGTFHKREDQHGVFYFTIPEEFQLRIYAHELAHIKYSGHDSDHRDLMFDFFDALVKSLF